MIRQFTIADEIINTVGQNRNMAFEIEALSQGRNNYISVEGKNPITIEIKCFVRTPPPSGFKTCPECGSFRVISGQQQLILSNEKVIQRTDTVNIRIVDADNDTINVRARIKGMERLLIR
jgi:hypothetical protein